MILGELNYLHRGDSLHSLCQDFNASKSPYAREILEYWKATGKPTSQIFHAIKNSQSARHWFHKNGLRGFSFAVHQDILFSFPLRDTINFRFAIVADSSLFYPKKVKDYIRYGRGKNHYRDRGFRSIGFALSRVNDACLFVFVLQSDLVFQGKAGVREHFRGWRKVLIREVVRWAKRHSLHKLRLVSAADVIAACHPEYPVPDTIPSIWLKTYDETAKFLNMKMETQNRFMNIQTLIGAPPVSSRDFWTAEVDALAQKLEA